MATNQATSSTARRKLAAERCPSHTQCALRCTSVSCLQPPAIATATPPMALLKPRCAPLLGEHPGSEATARGRILSVQLQAIRLPQLLRGPRREARPVLRASAKDRITPAPAGRCTTAAIRMAVEASPHQAAYGYSQACRGTASNEQRRPLGAGCMVPACDPA